MTVEPSADLPTLLWVSWSTDLPSRGSVEVVVGDDEPIVVASEEEATDHRVPVLGLPAMTMVSLIVRSQAGNLESEQTVTATTGTLPSVLPVLDAGTWDRTAATEESYVLLGLGSPTWSGMLVANRRGRVVWHYALDPGCYFVETGMLPEQPGVLAMAWCEEDMFVHRVPFDPRQPDEHVLLLDGHHAYAPLPDGGLAYCYEECRSWDHEELEREVHACGDGLRILEADGSISTLFSVWDWGVPASRTLRRSTADNPADWTHANAIDHLPVRDTLLFSLRNLSAALEIDLSSGVVVEEYGLTDGAAGYEEGTEAFNYQHDPNWTGDDTMLMVTTTEDDNGDLARETHAVELTVQEGTGLLEEVWSYHPGPNVFSRSGGGARRLTNGDTLVHWRDPRSRLREVTPDGEVVWELMSPDQAIRMGTPQLFRDFYAVEEDD